MSPAEPGAETAATPPTVTPSSSTLSPVTLLLLALMTFIWGFNWPIMKVALAEFPVFSFRALCIAGGAAGLFAIARLMGTSLRIPEGYRLKVAAIAFFNIVGWNMLALYGLTMLPAGRATILAFTTPLWLVPLSILFLNERLNGWKLFGLCAGVAGLAVLLGGDWRAMLTAPLGVVLMLLATLSWAISIILTKIYQVPMAGVPFVGWQMALGCIPFIIAAPIFDQARWHMYSAAAWGALFYNIFACFVFCYWAWNRMVTILPAQVSGLSTMMIPVVGVFSSMLMLGEQPGWPEYGALILMALSLASILKPQR